MERAWSYKLIFRYFFILSCLPLIIISAGVFLFTQYTIREQFLKDQVKIVENQNFQFNEQITQLELNFNYFSYDLQRKVKEIREINYKSSPMIKDISNSLFYFTNSNLLVEKSEVMLTGIGDDEYYDFIGEQGNFRKKSEGKYKFFLDHSDSSGWFEYLNDIYFIQKINLATHLLIKLDMAAIKELRFIENSNTYTELILNDKVMIQSKEQLHSKEVTWDLEAVSGHNVKRKDSYAILDTFRHLGSEWKILTVLDPASMFQPLLLYFRIVFIFIFCLLILMILLELLLYTKYARYIRNMMKNMFGNEAANYSNEFELIHEKWLSMVKDKSSLQGEISSKNQNLVSSLLQQVVNGKTNKHIDSMEKEIEKLGTNTKSGFYILNLTLTESVKKQLIYNYEGMISFADYLQAILADILTKDEYFILSHSYYSVFLLYSEKDYPIDTVRLARLINEGINRYVTITFHSEKVMLKDLHEEAEVLLAYRTYQKLILENQWIEVGKFNTSKLSYHPSVSDVYLESVLVSFATEDLKSVEVKYSKWLDSLIDNYKYQFMIIQEIQAFYERIRSILYQNKISVKDLEDYYTISRDLINQVSVESIGKIVWDRIILPCFALYAEESSCKIEAIVQTVIEQINKNYSNQFLSLEGQAAELNMEAGNLSRWFKNSVGINYIEYLTKIRMEKAVILLTTTEEPIKNIASKVGYEATYFNRIFKKNYGVTPGVYRRENCGLNPPKNFKRESDVSD